MNECEEVWINWGEARDRVEAAGLAAKGKLPSVLADWAQSNMVQCRAASLLLGDKGVFDAAVPARAWAIARRGERGRIDWAIGYIQCFISLQQGQRPVYLRAHGIQFLKAEMDRLAPSVPCPVKTYLEEPAGKPPAKNKGGAPRSAAWEDFISELAAKIHEEGIPQGEGTQGAEQFMEDLFDRLATCGKEHPQRSTVQPTIRAVLQRLRADN